MLTAQHHPTRLHDGWAENAFLSTTVGAHLSDIDAVAAVKVTRTLRTARQCMAPLEGRGVLAE